MYYQRQGLPNLFQFAHTSLLKRATLPAENIKQARIARLCSLAGQLQEIPIGKIWCI
jgi:hypothetical protein